MKKVTRDGKVAVLISPGYGSGWYTMHLKEILLFHPKIVKLVEKNENHKITEKMCQKILGIEDYICVLGAKKIKNTLVANWNCFSN